MTPTPASTHLQTMQFRDPLKNGIVDGRDLKAMELDPSACCRGCRSAVQDSDALPRGVDGEVVEGLCVMNAGVGGEMDVGMWKGEMDINRDIMLARTTPRGLASKYSYRTPELGTPWPFKPGPDHSPQTQSLLPLRIRRCHC